ncbi:TPA: hemagglutinin repeat-containing protein [Providencia rettgeri]
MTNNQVLWCLLFSSLFMISPYGYTENQLLPSTQESIQFEQKQRLESELSQRNLLEKQTTIPIEGALPPPSQDDSIVIRRDESNLMKLAASEPTQNINELLTKTGSWVSSGEINLTAGKNIEARGITFNSGKSIAFNAGQDILLGSKAIKDVDNVFKTNRYPELRSQLIANGNITLNAARDMDLQSANLQSKDKITALSGRDIKLTATAYSAIPNPNEDNQDVRYVTSTLSGDKGVTLATNGALTAQGSTIKSLGDITLSSGGNVRL